MEQKRKLMENAKQISQNDWLKRMCDTAIVEDDQEFIKAFNKRFEQFRKLFIDND